MGSQSSDARFHLADRKDVGDGIVVQQGVVPITVDLSGLMTHINDRFSKIKAEGKVERRKLQEQFHWTEKVVRQLRAEVAAHTLKGLNIED